MMKTLFTTPPPLAAPLLEEEGKKAISPPFQGGVRPEGGGWFGRFGKLSQPPRPLRGHPSLKRRGK
jgi:hypothetical protein